MLELALRKDDNENSHSDRASRRDFLLVSDRADQSADLSAILRTSGEVVQIGLDDLERQSAGYFRLFVDLDLSDVSVATRLRLALDRSPLRRTPRYFVTTADHHSETQASALRASAKLSRPFQPEQLLGLLRCDSATSFQARLDLGPEPVCVGVAAAHSVLVQIFEGLPAGRPLTLADVLAQEIHITEALKNSGLKAWLDVVNRHHNSSYRHCLSVTGFTVAFAQHLGFSVSDQRRLARAALLHDVGKAYIPIELLDKPGKLTDAERELMQTHARQGFDVLREQGGFAGDVLEVVLNHHELLDGSGYPMGLKGQEIADTVRMVTVADIYSALVEERAYRSGMLPRDAYAILMDMGGKLDKDLVAAFRPVALGIG
jgi:putative nucleotidyltransferase with HDIG domain